MAEMSVWGLPIIDPLDAIGPGLTKIGTRIANNKAAREALEAGAKAAATAIRNGAALDAAKEILAKLDEMVFGEDESSTNDLIGDGPGQVDSSGGATITPSIDDVLPPHQLETQFDRPQPSMTEQFGPGAADELHFNFGGQGRDPGSCNDCHLYGN